MKRSNRLVPITVTVSALLCLLLTPAGRADVRQYGVYEVHYSLFSSSFLQPGVAAAYGIVRAKDRAVINVAVRRRGDGAATSAAVAVVSGTRGDLIYKHPLRFREIREDQAIYHLADFPFVSGETLYFDIAITPEGEAGALELRFDKVLYAD